MVDGPRPPGTSPVWASIVAALRPKLSPPHRDALSQDVRFVESTDTSLRVGVLAQQLPSWVQGGLLALVDASVTDVVDGNCDLGIVPVPSKPLPLPLDPAHTFDHFTTGPSNQRARDLAFGVTRRPRQRPNPMLLYGPEAAGKTHLLRAVAQELAAGGESGRVHCISSERLSLELISAMRAQQLAEFQTRSGAWDALLVDDIDALDGREATQQELLRALEALVARGAPVVLTAPEPPHAIRGLSTGLREALSAECCVELTRPSWEMKVAIVLDRIDGFGVASDPEVASFLVGRLGSNLDRLDALLTRLLTHPLCSHGLTDVEVVRRVLGSGRMQAGPIPPEVVISLIARHFNLRIRDLRSATRSPRITTPRQIAMYLLRRHCSLSYPEIGQRFGRHHTTALHSVRQITRRLDDNAGLRSSVRLLEKELLQSLEEGA